MARMTVARLAEEFEVLRAEIYGHMTDVEQELRTMAAKVERADLTCTDLRNRLVAMETRRQK